MGGSQSIFTSAVLMLELLGPELDMDWIHPWIGLDWVRSFVRFIVFPKTEAPSSSFSFVKMHFWFSSQLVIVL